MSDIRPKIKKLKLREDGKIVPVKAGCFGETGSGKGYTIALLAVGLSVELHNKADVYVYDTEPGWQFVEKIFRIEGVKLHQEAGESFDGLRAARRKAEEKKCCAFIGDSYTHIWNELMASFMNKSGFIDFSDWNSLKPLWRDWIREFMNTPMHCMALGRLGWNWKPEEKTNRAGEKKIQMVKSDSKFNAGGGESFGYEPHLLIEMELARKDTANGRGGHNVHIGTVLKDRADVINGDELEFDALRGYKKGDYVYVWNALFPHIQEMQFIDNHVLLPGTKSTPPKTDSQHHDLQKERTVTIGEIKENFGLLWPGKKDEDKTLRAKVSERIFGVRSWDAIQECQLGALRAGLAIMRQYESMINPEDPLTTEPTILEMVEKAKKVLVDQEIDIAAQHTTSDGREIPF